MVVSGCYGRDYKKSKDAVKDWEDGKDFIIRDIVSQYYNKPCSIRDFKKEDRIELRYNQDRNLVFVSGSL